MTPERQVTGPSQAAGEQGREEANEGFTDRLAGFP